MPKSLKTGDDGIASNPNHNASDGEEKYHSGNVTRPKRERGVPASNSIAISETRAEMIPMRDREKMSAVRMSAVSFVGS